MPVRLLAFSGSARTGSLNQALLDLAVTAAETRGAEVTAIRLSDFELPVYDGDIEREHFPQAARELKMLMRAHHGFLIASPEHNGSVSAMLKNAIDWASRPTDGEGMVALSAFRGKVAGIMGASISPFGTLRGLSHLRQILSTIQVVVATEQVMVPFAHEAFDDSWALKDTLPAQLLGAMVGRVIELADKLAPPVS
jgi:NAD(P)H-dependent FMN reductase